VFVILDYNIIKCLYRFRKKNDLIVYNNNKYTKAMDNRGGFKSFQDFTPVVLIKNKKDNNISKSKSSSNIHIHKPVLDEEGEMPKTVYYTQEQRDAIKYARNEQKLNQLQLAQKIRNDLKADYIANIENGKTPYNQVAYKRICNVLKIKPLI
jgi:DNA-binding XRE family transcriptional regulator